MQPYMGGGSESPASRLFVCLFVFSVSYLDHTLCSMAVVERNCPPRATVWGFLSSDSNKGVCTLGEYSDHVTVGLGFV